MEAVWWDWNYTQKWIFLELKRSEGDAWMRNRFPPHRDPSHRNVRQPQEYQIWENESFREFISPADGFTAFFNCGNLQIVSTNCLASICPMALGTKIRVIEEVHLQSVNYIPGSRDRRGIKEWNHVLHGENSSLKEFSCEGIKVSGIIVYWKPLAQQKCKPHSFHEC